MARYNEILVGRYNRFLQKLLSMKGDAPAPQLGSEWMPAINYFTGVEERYLQGINRFCGSFAAPAQAANINGIKIRNPATSNVVAVIESLSAQSNVADANLGVGHGASATDYQTLPALTNTRLDPRGNPNPSMVVSSTSGANSAVGFGATIDNIGAAAAVINQRLPIIFTDDQEITVLPGDALQIASSVVNSVLTVNILWRERFLEESERT